MSELKKEITLWRGLVLAISTVIGSGLLGLPGLALEAGDAYQAAGGWMLVCVAAIPLIYIFARLGLRYASAAGLAKYAEESIGEWGGYAVTTVVIGTLTIGIPIVALIGASFIQNLLGLPEITVSIMAVIILILVTVTNVLGVKAAGLVNSASFVILIVMVVMIVSFNLNFVGAGFEVFSDVLCGKEIISYRGIWSASALLFWAFLGWENLSFGLEEFKNPKKAVPVVYWASYGIVVVLYLSLAAASIGADVSGVYVRGPSGLTALLNYTPFGNLLILVIIMIIIANLNSWAFGLSRLIYASGRSGILPAFFGKLSKNSIPVNSLLCLLVIYICIALLQNFSTKLTISSLMMLVNQNFIVLYLASLFAFWKTEKGIRRALGSLPAFISCCFLLSGFTVQIIYPGILIATGCINYRLKRRRAR